MPWALTIVDQISRVPNELMREEIPRSLRSEEEREQQRGPQPGSLGRERSSELVRRTTP